jgi:ectoine hydroxylase-related dioxygenase (phytanoyl-CoA dioxygenase family)
MMSEEDVPGRLSAEQVSDYRSGGYLVCTDPVFTDEKFSALREHAEQCYTRVGVASSGKPHQLIDCPHWWDPSMFKWVFSEELLDIAESLVGPDIGVFACHFLRKAAGVGKRVPWHEDSAYWKALLSPMEVASVTVALEPAAVDNGCMRVIRGSHHHGYSDYAPVEKPDENVFKVEITPEGVDESLAVDLVLDPNQASIHDVKIIHGSNPNTGPRERFAFTVRYFPTHVKFTNAMDGDFHIYLARGVDHAGNTYSDPTRAYEGRASEYT